MKPLFESPVAEKRKHTRHSRRNTYMNDDREIIKPFYVVAKPKIKHRDVLCEFQIPLPPLKALMQNSTHLVPDFPKPATAASYLPLGNRRADNDKRCRMLKRLKENVGQGHRITMTRQIGPDATLIATRNYRRASVSNPRNLMQYHLKDTIERRSANRIHAKHFWRNALREANKICCLTTLNSFRTDC